MKISQHIDLLLTSLIVVLLVIFSFAAYSRLLILSFFVGPMRFSHWLSIIGTAYIAVAVVLFVVLMRSQNANRKRLLRFHIFGNLLFFALISLHFASQVSRPSIPDLGTGLAMYIAMGLQVATGFTQRFSPQSPLLSKLFNAKTNMFIHAGLVLVFFIVILFHVLHGFGIAPF